VVGGRPVVDGELVEGADDGVGDAASSSHAARTPANAATPVCNSRRRVSSIAPPSRTNGT
jgi:hypothetical protein